MPETNIGSADYSDLTNTVDDYSVATQTTDAADGNQETKWVNTNWSQQLGYFKKIPELKRSINAKATWTIGKGYKAEPITTLTLMNIKGNGKDTFNTILENMVRTYLIGGDAFAEIIRDNEGKLINIKPLDPESIRIVANKQGLIIRYEQISKNKTPDKRFKPEQIFHLCKDRIADEIHGTSLIDAVEWIILARNEAMADMKKTIHWHGRPHVVFKVDTDDTTKIAAFKTKADAAINLGENLYVPKDTVEAEVVSVATNATISPLPWINQLTNYFYEATGVPQIIVGGSQEMTEASAKIAYLAFEQTIEEEQLYIEEAVLDQLNLEINLEFPATLQNEMISDMGKEESMQAATPEDTSVTSAETGGVA